MLFWTCLRWKGTSNYKLKLESGVCISNREWNMEHIMEYSIIFSSAMLFTLFETWTLDFNLFECLEYHFYPKKSVVSDEYLDIVHVCCSL